MKHALTVVIGAAVAIASAASPGAAQATRPFQFSVGAGYTAMTGEDRDFYNDGLNIQGGISFHVNRLQSDARLDVTYNRMGGKNRDTGGDTLVIGDLSVLGANLGFVYPFSPPTARTRPFFSVGLGMYRTEQDAVLYDQPVSGSSTDFGTSLGLGLLFGAGPRKATLEFRVLSVFTEGDSAQLYPLTVGITF